MNRDLLGNPMAYRESGDLWLEGIADRHSRIERIERETVSQTVAAQQLLALIERIERLESEKKTIADDIKEVYAEAKGNGYDTKAIRAIITLRKKDQAERQEEESILDLYKAAIGLV